MKNSETIEEEKLAEIAKALGVTVEAIKSFLEENRISYFNSFHDNSINNGHFGNNNHCTFNPLDKLIETFHEKEKLYERLLQAEKDKIEYLEKLLKKIGYQFSLKYKPMLYECRFFYFGRVRRKRRTGLYVSSPRNCCFVPSEHFIGSPIIWCFFTFRRNV